MTEHGLIILACLLAIAASLFMYIRFYVFLVPLLLSLVLSGCLGTKQTEPIVIEKKCYLEPLAPKPEVPELVWITEGCSHYKCLTEDQYKNYQIRTAIFRQSANYCYGVYERARERFGK